MVAELAGISATITEQKRSTGTTGGSRRPRPRWIQAATREPIYSVLDSNTDSVSLATAGSSSQENVVVISAINGGKGRKISEVTSVNQKESPYVWLPTETAEIRDADQIPKVEVIEEEPIYSVVRKPPKIRQRESSEVLSRQQELNKWLQTASKQSGIKCLNNKTVDLNSVMYSADGESKLNFEWQRDGNRGPSIPRGVVGLVGPYRVYPDPNERREYILREEELIEDIVDSVSEVAAREAEADAEDEVKRFNEPHQRAKWRIRDDDEETLVPDLPDPDSWKESQDVDKPDEHGWKENLEPSPKEIENWKIRESDPVSAKTSMILPGTQERAVDVPDGASSVSTPVKGQHDQIIPVSDILGRKM